MTNKEQELHMAVRGGDTTGVERLLSGGTNINCLYYGWTPLQMAIDIGRQQMATLLIDSGCDISFHDAHSKAPFEEAVMKKQPQVVEALLKKGASGDVLLCNGHTPLTYAVEAESVDLVQALVKGGVDVNMMSKQGHSALYLAAQKGLQSMVRDLVTAGTDLNQPCKQEGDATPLIAAAANEHKHVVAFLAKCQGCDLDLQDSDGWSALWHAYSNASEEVSATLLRAGADKNLPNTEGVSVVDDARENEDDVMTEVFQKYNNMV